MSEAANPRAALGGNKPPLDDADDVTKRLEREHSALLVEASMLEADSLVLPEAPETDEESAQVSDFVLKVRRIAKRLDDTRADVGKPYLEAQRVINSLFNDYREPLVTKGTGLADKLAERVTIYNTAKAERIRAERLAREREEREKAEAARREEERKRQEAEAAERAANEAAARQRAAKNEQERKEAEAAQREQMRIASQARRAAETEASAAASAERRADQNQRASEAPTGQLGRVSTGGSTTSITKFWTHTITDAGLLMKSLGPMGEYLSNDTIVQALTRATRERAAAGSIESFVVPGVRFWQDSKTNITQRR